MHSRKKQRKGVARTASSDGSEAIAVVVRIRPLVNHERGQSECLEYDDKEIKVSSSKKNYEFSCTKVFNSTTTQEMVFQRSGVRPLIESSLMGYNSTLFAYGPTGCGKTFSVLGDLDGKQHNKEGLIPRSVREIFNLAELQENREIKLRVSCFEIYREMIHDLFIPSAERSSLLCREHPKYGFFVDGLKLQQCFEVNSTLIDVISALRGRQTSGHLLNERSSRSHCMLTLHVDSLPSQGEGQDERSPPTYGSMTFVDLAGSERPKETGSSGKTLKDAGHINKSLYMLGKVISGMVKGRKKQLVPYRDSALTKLLIGSLGGSSKTMMFGCISPAASAITETIRTLSFANQVKGIQNKPKVQLDPREKLIQDLRNEIDRLREENERLKDLFSATSPSSLNAHLLNIQMESAHAAKSHSANHAPSQIRKQLSTSSLPLVHATAVTPKAQSQTPKQNTSFPSLAQPPVTKPMTKEEEMEEELQEQLEEALAQQLFDQLQF